MLEVGTLITVMENFANRQVTAEITSIVDGLVYAQTVQDRFGWFEYGGCSWPYADDEFVVV
jgi:hypothetical protein